MENLNAIQRLFAITFAMAPIHKRPLAHRTKKGPGRKHQQTKTLTKEQREAVDEGNSNG